MANINSKRNEREELEFAVDQIWISLKETVSHYKKSDKSLRFDDSKEQQFKNTFVESYTSIKNTHMDPSVRELDRHKVAAVIIDTTLTTDIISREGSGHGRIFLGQEMISAEVAFEWMILRFKRKLNELDIDIANSFYHMPIAFACDTPYFDIFCRNLYFAKQNQKLSVLDIAEKLFLLEYITLLKLDVDPQLLHGK